MFTVLIISVIVAGILCWVYYHFCAEKILAVNAEVERILKAQDVAAALEKSKTLETAWKAFRNSLTEANDVRYSTVDASEFFSVATLTQGLNMTFWQSYGGIFTGLGILGTFFGLTYGLGGLDITNGDIDKLKTGIADLLSGVNTAFITSLVGIGSAVVYSFAHHFLLKTLQRNIQSLTDKLDEIYPRRIAEDWLAEKFSESKRQTRALQSIDLETQNQVTVLQSIDTQAQSQAATLESIDTETKEQTVALKNIGEDVANAIYDGLDERMNDAVDKFCDRLEEKILPQVDRICAAIEHLGADGSDKLNELFTKGVGSQMDRFSAALENFTNKTEKMLANAQEVSTLINGQLLATLETINDNLKRNAEAANAQRDADYKNFLATLKGLTDTMNAVVDNLKRQQEDTAKNFEQLLKVALNNFNAGMKQTMTNVQTEADKTNEQSRAASEQFLATLAGLSKTLQETADRFNAQQETAAGNFDALLKNSLDNFVEVMRKVLTDAKEKSEATDQNFLTTLSRLTDTLNALVEKFKAQQENAADNFEVTLSLLIDELQNFVEQQKKILNDNATGNAAQINQAVVALRTIVDRHNAATKKTFDQIQNLLSETESLLESMDDASTSFKAAAEPVKQSTAQLAKNLVDNSAQMNTLAEANRITRDNLAALSTRLATFVQNFNGIANELERSITIVTDSLDNYNGKISDGLNNSLTAFDSTAHKAYSELNTIVEALNDAIEDFGNIFGYVKQKRGTVIK